MFILSSGGKQQAKAVIYSDKNHTPVRISKTIDLITKHGLSQNKKVKLLKVALIAELSEKIYPEYLFLLSFWYNAILEI